ncbi:MAG: flagellin [Verrucomicrobia bacterium]|nr:flagellin [Verrucomicrobiota bacterium]MCF7708208.1 flagellin [Verrucomicrobiota bacterium]
MILNHNLQANSATNNLQTFNSELSKSLKRLSSGSKITEPADDAAGLAMAMRLDAKLKRIDAAESNVGNAVSFLQTQDGYLNKISSALERMSELAILAQDATKSDDDRSMYNIEFSELQNFIDEVKGKSFNGVDLFGSDPATPPDSLEVTIDSEGETMALNVIDLAASEYSDAISLSSVDSTTNAASAINAVNAALDQLAEDRATIGASQSRLRLKSEQLTVGKENLTAATSRIQDVNVAEESTQFARSNMLVQASTAMLAQANTLPQNVLKLLQ